ncbi:peptidoglycan-binding protein [Patescibacteria group bacterium]|nr:peptidoglycan-binding protein [Patescibacteria group bacterium]
MSIFKLKDSAAAKAVSVFAGVAMALTLVFGGAVAPAQAQTVEELTAQISSLLAMISSLQAQLSNMGGTTTTTGVSYNFTKNLTMGDSGADVLNLQKVLNMSSDTMIAASGVGSKGNETEYFGGLTKAAVIKFQNKYASEILTPVGLTAGTGFVGASTRAKLNAMTVATTPTTPVDPTTPVVTPAGTGLTISAGSQPAATLAVSSAARIPFTKVILTASADGDVVVNSLLIERTGLAADAAFAGIILLDEDGTQIGIAKTLNSLHQATVGENFTVKAGTSKTVTIAGNMVAAATMASYRGQVGSLSVIGVNTSAAVNGALPIMGTAHTMNDSLSIGSATPARGVNDPNATATKEVGVDGYTFSSIKVTAGSAEKIRLHSIRWNQSGSVSASDLGNLKTYVDGVAYDVMVSSDGKYYTSTFGTGLVVDKGLAKEITIKGDIISGSGRTIAFDLYKNTDLYVTGETYGYGITPASTGTGFSTGTPWYDASVVTVSNGSLQGSKSTTVEAQNIAENVANQVLGGFDIEAKGEAISVASMVFNVTLTGSSAAASSAVGQVDDITNVSLVDANGSVVAGPVDAAYTSVSAQTTGTITFTDTVTFQLGKGTYTLKGQLGTNFVNDQTIIIDTNPTDDWTTVTGQTTGNSITPTPDATLTSNTMTLKTGTAVISTSASPVAQNVVAGAQGFVMANFQFDATASGEDVKFNTLVLNNTVTGANSEYQTGCQLFDGTTALNTGSNIKDIASGETAAQTFTLDSAGLVIPKGTLKTIALKCNISASASGDTYLWSMTAAQTGSGLDSGSTITTATPTGSGQIMTATTGGTFTVVKDDSSPSYKIVAAGTTDVVLAKLKFTGTNEAINLKKLGLQLTAASSSPSDLTRVTLWDGTTQVGVATFTSTDYATSTLTTDFMIPKDGSKVMTIKGDLAKIGTSQVGTQGALLKVNFDGGYTASTQGVGAQSGTTINTTSASDTAVDGVRVFRAYPEFAKINVSNTVLISSTDVELYKFSITAKDADGLSDGIGLNQVTVNVATSSASAVSGTTTVTNLEVYAYTDSSFSNPVSGYTNGLLATAAATLVTGDNEVEFSSVLNIPAGATYYFKVEGDTTLTAGTGTFSGNVTTKISGDAAYPAMATLMGTETTVDADTNNDFVWSGHATTTSALAHVDWSNGYLVDGLPSGGSSAQTISK